LEPSAPDTQAQNGGAERSGGVVKDKSRTIRIDANLPWELWPEIVRATVYLHNRTPNYANGWKSPYEVFFTTAALQDGIITPPRKPNQSHLKVYGCKAFALTDDTLRGKSRLQRLDPRAWIGYLVGYRSSNIYRIWIPSMAKVISTRDVVFDEDSVFDGKTESLMDNLMHSTLDEIAAWIRTVERTPTLRILRKVEFHRFFDINRFLSSSLFIIYIFAPLRPLVAARSSFRFCCSPLFEIFIVGRTDTGTDKIIQPDLILSQPPSALHHGSARRSSRRYGHRLHSGAKQSCLPAFVS
jgi:hypothetical protein